MSKQKWEDSSLQKKKIYNGVASEYEMPTNNVETLGRWQDPTIDKLQQENQQLKLDYELYKDNHIYKNYEVETKDNTIKQLKDAIEKVKEDIVFCINGMKNEFACTDSRTNRELHTMVKILEDRLQILDKVKEI